MSHESNAAVPDPVESGDTAILITRLQSRLHWIIPASALLTTVVFALSLCVVADVIRFLVLTLVLVVVMAGFLNSPAKKLARMGDRLGGTWRFTARNVALGSSVVVLAGLVGLTHAAVYVLGLLSAYCVLLVLNEFGPFSRHRGSPVRQMLLDVLLSVVLVYVFGLIVFCVLNRPGVLSVPDYERGKRDIIRIPVTSVPGPGMHFIEGHSTLEPEYSTMDLGLRLYRPAILLLSRVGVLERDGF